MANLTIISASNPRFIDDTGNAIRLNVVFDGIGEVPFVATPDDVEAHGVELFNRAAAGEFGGVAAYVPAAVTQAQLIAYANSQQWAIATGGKLVTINGLLVPFSTTIDSLSLMSGKVARLNQPNPPASINWQTGPTTFMSIAAADFTAAATTISDWVQALFDALPAIFAGIASGAITTTGQIDDALAAVT